MMQENLKKLSPGIHFFNADIAAETGSSNPKLNEKYNVDVREFVVLACLDDDDGRMLIRKSRLAGYR